MNNFNSVKAEDNALVLSDLNTTKFDNDAMSSSAMMNGYTPMSRDVLSNASSGITAGIAEFLRRPQILEQITWTSASADLIASDNLPGQLFLNSPMWIDKVDGFLGLRATIVIKIQVNANPFQQGRLILGYIPCPFTQEINRYRSLTQLTQLPHVQFDACCDTEAEIRIPFIAPWTHFNLLSRGPTHAQLFLWVYSPLLTGPSGAQDATITLWGHFEDLELVGPTISSQGASGTLRGRGKYSIREKTDGLKTKPDPPKILRQVKFKVRSDPIPPQPISDTLPAASPTEEEQVSSGVGPVSSIFHGVTKVSKILEDVPIVSEVVKTAGWVSNILGNVASAIGWSKPMNEQPAERMDLCDRPYANNCDAIDNSMPMSLFTSNKTEYHPQFSGSDIDEMSLTHIAGIPAWYQTITWAATDANGTQLLNYTLNPLDFFTTATVTGSTGLDQANLRLYVPVAYLARFFRLFRGSLKFTFKIVKTGFHSGRLLLAYVPGDSSSLPATINIEDTEYLHREIIDVREGYEFTFTIPFISLYPYISPDGSSQFTEDDLGNGIGQDNYGQLRLYVLNSLVAPDSVSQDVEILVEVSAAPDVEYAIPKEDTGLRIFAQGAGPDDTNPCAIVIDTDGIGNSSILRDNLASAKYCIGERVLSILQLMKRFAPFRSTANDATFSVKPYYLPADTNFGGTRTDTTFTFDYMSLFAGMYSFFRGGVRLKWYALNMGQAAVTRSYLVTDATLAAYVTAPTAPSTTSSYLVMLNNHNCGPEAQIPQYYTTYMRPCTQLSVADPLNFQIRTATAPTSGTFDRAVSDDFYFGFFIGVPPVVNSWGT